MDLKSLQAEKVDRFTLESQIMECWSIREDIDNLMWAMRDSRSGMTEDEIDNYLIGLQSMYQVRFEKLWNTFELLIHKGDLR